MRHPVSVTRPIALILSAVLVAACGSAPVPSPTPAVPVSADSTLTPAPSTAASLPPATLSPTPAPSFEAGFAVLDGAPAALEVGLRVPVAVMVDDNVEARPQYGLNAASLVYQAPADGGEDRYMFVFQEMDGDRIEPIRSGRPYFVNWASEYGAAFAHYGGDLRTRTYLPTIDRRTLWDVDALNGSASAFNRDKARDAPHNALSSSDRIRKRAIERGAPATMPVGAETRPFADDLPRAERPDSGSIAVPYKRGTTGYTYDPESNAYLRSVAGKPQLDAADGKRVTARNVVVLFMALSIDPESEPGHHRPMLDQVGSGKALVFRDGHVFEGTWRKPTPHALTRFYDASGAEVTLVRGPIFIQVVPTGTKVTYDAAR